MRMVQRLRKDCVEAANGHCWPGRHSIGFPRCVCVDAATFEVLHLLNRAIFFFVLFQVTTSIAGWKFNMAKDRGHRQLAGLYRWALRWHLLWPSTIIAVSRIDEHNEGTCGAVQAFVCVCSSHLYAVVKLTAVEQWKFVMLYRSSQNDWSARYAGRSKSSVTFFTLLCGDVPNGNVIPLHCLFVFCFAYWN